MENYRIALVSDVHVGPTVGSDRVEYLVRLVNQEKVGKEGH